MFPATYKSKHNKGQSKNLTIYPEFKNKLEQLFDEFKKNYVLQVIHFLALETD